MNFSPLPSFIISVNTAHSVPHVCYNVTFKNHRSGPLSTRALFHLSTSEIPSLSGSWVRPHLLTRWKREGITIYRALMPQTLSYTLDSFSQLNLLTYLKGKNHYSYCSSERGQWYWENIFHLGCLKTWKF